MNTNSILIVLTLGSLMAAVDTTIVLLALPTITSSLHTDLLSSIWVLLAYMIVISVLSTQAGRIGDLFGKGKIYNLGFVIFTAASALCGISSNIDMLIVFRIIQAIGGSMLVANSSSIVADVFPPNRRGKAYGITSLGWNIGALVGIVLGGVLTTFFGWQYIFYINVPIGIVAVLLGVMNIKDINKVNTKLDMLGAILLGISLALISLSLMFIAASGISTDNIIELALGVALIPFFLLNETRSKYPILNLKIFKIRLLTYSILANFLQGIGGLSLSFLLIMYLQGVRGLSPLDSSLLLTPGYVIASILAPFMGRVADRGKPGIVAGIGLMFIFITMILYFFLLTPTTDYYLIVGISAITGIGSAMFWPSNSTAIMFHAPKEYYGSVSGLSRTLGNIGTILSYVLSIVVATLSIPRSVAFEIFIGTTTLNGDVSVTFVNGLHFAFLISSIIIVVAMIFSFMSGKTQESAIK
ncbi:DHA2 family efflux MFS transporter permease subunit [Saccharolobus solfataricus]|uniref:Permease, multidrug resistance protein n=3 Tax=Saccharolobus solfataricus TaxID=2287 RepID=Q97VB9_SACS2|nr:MFS transporter [Saccharolobus solfataricus]AAK42826.1 Permease, multidrug resistance protein [Saccharolobus solfataricus P2]AKA72921.1 DHA2 family efflux MFS transporter permease subunit [Saccharolobus solfataricus]AKA75620.1 DHA2 family efflux MFS transporter permease subunit [Saccharolobus solfataricus]AKA78313.1 DHA2 family efflux MFS transporter permease subunit [Saccharolobus solfataricus]AZF67432.1 DHA2 family efflux MFS transporter permease subunit [Saccharolobus solfataricus]